MKVKPLLTGILIGAIALPTVSLGGTFVFSLIAGKSVDESVQILATQLDKLIGRVGIVETKQVEQEQTVSELQSQFAKEEACREYQQLLSETPRMTQNETGVIEDPVMGIDLFIEFAQKEMQNLNSDDQLYKNFQQRIAKARANKEPLIFSKQQCLK